MPRGRPTKSIVRDRIISLLKAKGPMYGYELYKTYIQGYPKVTMRVIYYNLKKGVAEGRIAVDSIKKEKGNYSWGGEVERIYYKAV